MDVGILHERRDLDQEVELKCQDTANIPPPDQSQANFSQCLASLLLASNYCSTKLRARYTSCIYSTAIKNTSNDFLVWPVMK